MTDANPQLDKLLSGPTRLAIVALLASVHWAEFGFVRDRVSITESALSKQISILSASKYVEVRKGYVGRRPRTWINLTDKGRHIFECHLTALNAIISDAASAARVHRANGPNTDPTGDEA